MILDSSAIVASLCREPGHLALIEKVIAADTLGVGAPTVVETAMVLTIKLRVDGLAMVNEFLRESGTQSISFTDQHASIAFGAYLRYGKGRHPAKLNFGDCISYALAKARGLPLLFKGGDFALTDIRRALPA